MNYRPEIDGLRAIAVLPVILFHAGFHVFSGGYVGVDVFFVISGYLITTILINDLEAGKFSIIRFYERRARRILPALLLVMLVCLPVAWFVMLPAQLEELGWNTMAVALFVSNIALWLNTDYFAASAELNPLLHTWSLAVEEQFYIFFPPLLWALWKAGRRWPFTATVLLSIASLLLAEWGWRNAPDANFYLLPFRAWELGAGSICAFLLHGRAPRKNDLLSLGGVCLIFYSIFAYDNETPFPSVWALAPVLGTALIILCTTPSSLLGRALSLKPVILIGLISYSAYLWHQPLFAFARLSTTSEPAPALMAALGLMALVLAYLTWRFIENPFRSHNRQPPVVFPGRKAIFTASGIALVAFVGIGLLAYVSGGFPQRSTLSGSSYADLDLDQRLEANYGLSEQCRGFNSAPECRTGNRPRVLLWGDSNAMHLGQALLHSPSAPDFIQFTMSACGPFSGLSALAGGRYDARFGERCIEYNDKVIGYIEENNIELVIASSAMRPVVRRLYTRQGDVLPVGSLDTVLDSMRETAQRVEAAGARIVWISPPPTNGDNLSSCAVQAVTQGNAADGMCTITVASTQGTTKEVQQVLEAAQDFMPVFFLQDLLCDSDHCSTLIDGKIIYRDEGHLSIEGAQLLGEKYNLMREIRRASRRPASTATGSGNQQPASRPTGDQGGQVPPRAALSVSEQITYVILPPEIRFDFRFELTSERLFGSNNELRRGVMLEVQGQDARNAFNGTERALIRAGYRSSSTARTDKNGQVTGFYSKRGQPTLYVRSSPLQAPEAARPGTTSTVWISWEVMSISTGPE